MGRLILHPTDMSQWHALVNEAQASSQVILPENTESYLVFLLMRFAQTPELVESVLALDFLQSMQAVGSRQVELLREVGDKSLLLSGLFPGIAEKRHLKLTYFVDMGQSAYLSVSELEASTDRNLYLSLSEEFKSLQGVLNALGLQSDFLDLG